GRHPGRQPPADRSLGRRQNAGPGHGRRKEPRVDAQRPDRTRGGPTRRRTPDPGRPDPLVEGRSGGTGPGRLLLRLARSTHVGHERLVSEAVPETVVFDDAVAEIGGLPLESLEAAAQVGEGLGQYFVVAYERRRQVRQPRL